MRRIVLLLIIAAFSLSLFGGCLIRTNTGHGHQHSKRCRSGEVLVKQKNGKWKCKKPKKAKPKKRDHRK